MHKSGAKPGFLRHSTHKSGPSPLPPHFNVVRVDAADADTRPNIEMGGRGVDLEAVYSQNRGFLADVSLFLIECAQSEQNASF